MVNKKWNTDSNESTGDVTCKQKAEELIQEQVIWERLYPVLFFILLSL